MGAALSICRRVVWKDKAPMLRIVVEITGGLDDAQGVKEKLATDLEKFGDVCIAEVRKIEPEQLKMEG